MELRQRIRQPLDAQICLKTIDSLHAPCPAQTATLPLFAQSNFIWQRQSGTHSDRRSPPLNNAGKKRIQQIIGIFLYYATAVDPTLLMALSNIACQSAAPTERTKQRVDQFLDYMWTHPDAIIRYRASDMVLNNFTQTHRISRPPRLDVVPVDISSSAAFPSMVPPSN